MAEFCRKCHAIDFYYQQKGMQVGKFCANCGAWQKWVPKKELSIIKARGSKIFSENAVIQLKKNANLGIEILDAVSQSTNVSAQSIFDNTEDNLGFDVQKDTKMNNSIDIETEVEKRVQERLKVEKDKLIAESKHMESQIDSSSCPVCNGDVMTPSGDSQVELSIFDGSLAVTDKAGLKILGVYKINRCPYCGRKF